MNKRIFIAATLSMVTVLAIQYFTHRNDPPKSEQGIESGQFYSAPEQKCWHRNPNREVDFIDKKVDAGKEKETVVETDQYIAKFSNFGGILKSFIYKHKTGKPGKQIEILSNDTLDAKEQGCFLLAFEEKTPYHYKLAEEKEEEGVNKIVYEVKHNGWLVKKIYSLYKDSYKIDLNFEFIKENKDASPIIPRLFFVSPYASEVKDNETNAFVNKGVGSVDKISSSEELTGVWGAPEIFGGEDKYFATCLAKDKNNFAFGGYYKRINRKLFSIIECDELKDSKNFATSFYVGPKLLNSLVSVDERLEYLLSFGWLSWFCKILLRLLDIFYQYFKNYGVAIIVLTILLKIPFIPLTIISRNRMEEYQKYQPTITRIRNKYRTDLQKQQEEIVKFHKEHNLSPAAPMVGCMPLLIQLPILFALYRFLGNYLALYDSPFVFWIKDLAAKDPYYVLPLLMGATMLLLQQSSPSGDEKQKIFMMFMPILMTAVFINFPAGLVLYWLMNNLLTLFEDFLRKRVFG